MNGRKKNLFLSAVVLCICIVFSYVYVNAREKDLFIHVNGTDLYMEDGTPYQIKAINLSNCLSSTYAPRIPDNITTTEKTYKEISEMGFNSARFLINYQIFEDDDNPYVYKQTGWDWIDRNIKWAQKYNIKLIINMHIPQGGYQSLGKGEALWQEENEDRLIALWKAIAKRYKDEPTIIGWGIVNEPQVTCSENFELWNSLANRLVYEIRTVDTKHICFVEEARVFGTSETFIPKVKDSNTVYETHEYPFSAIDYYRKDTNNSNIHYGDEKLVFVPDSETTIVSSQVANLNLKKAGSADCWNSMNCILMAPENVNAASLKTALIGVNSNATIQIRNIIVNEYDEKNNYIQTVYRSNDNLGKSYYCGVDKGNAYSKFKTYVNNGLINFTIKGGSNYFDFGDYSINKYFKVTPGYKYTVYYEVKHTKLSNDNAYVKTMLNFVNSPNMYSLDQDYIKTVFNIENLEKEFNAPVFVGEFGVTRDELDNEKAGYKFLIDALELIMSEEYHFAYFNYQSSSHGLYTSSFKTLANRNETLKNLFRTYLCD